MPQQIDNLMKNNSKGVTPIGHASAKMNRFLAFGWLGALFFVGCDLPDRPTLKPVKQAAAMPSENPVADDDTVKWELPTALEEPTWETWDAYFINNKHVGYSNVKSSPTAPDEEGDVHFTLDHRVYQTAGNATTLQRLSLDSNETRDGRLLSFEGSMQVGLAVTRFSGDMEGSTLVVEIRDGSEVERQEIPWKYNYRGMFAVEQSLRAKPMRESGETRSLKMLISGQYDLATAKLRCSGNAVVPLLDGTERELIEINVELVIEGSEPIYSAIWTDEDGNVVRTYSSVLNIIAYRTDSETARELRHDDLVPAWIPVSGKLERPNETKRVAYRVQQLVDAQGQIAEELKPGPGQFVRDMGDGEIQVLVSRQDEKPSAGFIEKQPKPVKADSRPSLFIDSKSDMVTQFAEAAIGTRSLSKRALAVELAGTAQRMVNLRRTETGLAKASEIVVEAQADSTQMAILLAALLRASKIPARVAVGLKFEPAQQSPRVPQRMVSHVWTLAYIGNKWIHLDGTEGGLAAADRIMFASTSLVGEGQNEPFRLLTREIGRIDIKVLVAKH